MYLKNKLKMYNDTSFDIQSFNKLLLSLFISRIKFLVKSITLISLAISIVLFFFSSSGFIINELHNVGKTKK